MTTIELVRLLVADKDPLNYLFSDEELQYLIDKNTIHMVVEAEVKDTESKIYEYPDYEFISELKVFNPVTQTPVVDFQAFPNMRRIVLMHPLNAEVLLVEGDVLDVDNLRADACEMIAIDFRKLQNYSLQNTSGNLDTAKEHLLRLARYFRKPKMTASW